jgi:transketolase
MDGVQAANSGHPGMPMGMADVAAVLFLKYIAHCPSDTPWVNRDRFVLSAGHGSMLLYSLLHLSEYSISLSDLENFRQWESATPGHPEYGHTPGVETTTGPLGQGCGNAVGMAIAEQMLAQRFNTPEFPLVDHYTYAICGDGDMMEGISHEAFSLAGHLGLNKLIVFYDDNRITIEGSTDLAYSEDPKKRFQSYGWNVLEIDAHDFEQIEKAVRKARRSKDKPTLVVCHSHIAHGSPNKHDTSSAHGEPLGEDEIKASKLNLGLPEDRKFFVPDQVREFFHTRMAKTRRMVRKWNKIFEKYAAADPEKAELWKSHFEEILSGNLTEILPEFDPAKPIATRAASGKVIQALADAVPWLIGGSADLAPSTKTLINGAGSVGRAAFDGRNLHFGVREHGMGAIMNGIALHGGFRVYGATFFVFADYCRPTIRLAALMKLPVIYVFTHDSFYVGEDGPTHQPIEQIASLRCMPNLTVIRPADATETGAAWLTALKNTDGPTALLLTRQALPIIDRENNPKADNLEKGAYVLWQSSEQNPDVTLIASGSEVSLALRAAQRLGNDLVVRVVSMPSWELFEKQDADYRNAIIQPGCRIKLAIEAGASMGWKRYVGDKGKTICIDHFGASAPAEVLEQKFGFTVENVVETVKRMHDHQQITDNG